MCHKQLMLLKAEDVTKMILIAYFFPLMIETTNVHNRSTDPLSQYLAHMERWAPIWTCCPPTSQMERKNWSQDIREDAISGKCYFCHHSILYKELSKTGRDLRWHSNIWLHLSTVNTGKYCNNPILQNPKVHMVSPWNEKQCDHCNESRDFLPGSKRAPFLASFLSSGYVIPRYSATPLGNVEWMLEIAML